MITHINEMAIQRIYKDYDYLQNISYDDAKTILDKEIIKQYPDLRLITLLINIHKKLAENFDLTKLYSYNIEPKTRLKLIKLFTSNGADINKQSNVNKESIIFYALRDNTETSLNIIEYLLNNDADIYIKNDEDDTPVISLLKSRDSILDEFLTKDKINLLLSYNIDLCKNASISPTVAFLNSTGRYNIFTVKKIHKKLFNILKENDRMFTKYNPDAIVGSPNALPRYAYFAYQELNS